MGEACSRIPSSARRISPDTIYIVCNQGYRFYVGASLQENGEQGRILLEPAPRNTAPVIALAAFSAREQGDPLLLVLPSDHILKDDSIFTNSVYETCTVAEQVTLEGDNSYHNGNGFVAPGTPGDAARMEAGSTIGSFYMWKFAGFDDEGSFLLYNKDGEVIPAAQKTENDKQYIGNYTPKLIIGWSHTLTYKNFDLGINLRSWIDFDVYNTINMYYGIQGQGNLNVLKDAYGKFNHIKGEKQICDYFLEDGTFLKIDAITLGYTLPMKKYTNNLIDRIRIYGTVGNVCTITGYSGMNPEVDITGWDKGTEKFWSDFYPVVRTWTLGMQFNF